MTELLFWYEFSAALATRVAATFRDARRPLVGQVGNFAWWFDGRSLRLAQAHHYNATVEP